MNDASPVSAARRIRPPAVAGTFYPDRPDALRSAIAKSFEDAVPPTPNARSPRAIVVPPAGYVYSGPVAAGAWARVRPLRGQLRRVLLLGPSHHVGFRGLRRSSAAAWRTPLGDVPLDPDAGAFLDGLPWVEVDDRAHAPEHCLEVQLPFLQTVLDEVTIVPLLVGDTRPEQVAAVIETFAADPATLVVVSTDLSHYLRYDTATAVDARTAGAVLTRRPEDVTLEGACGARPLRGLLHAAREEGWTVEQIDLRNSGDTAGDRARVVGYGAFAVA